MVQYQLDATFTALSDRTRRGILERLDRSEATITELAEIFEMTLTGITKHIHLLEQAGLVVTEKRGRVRHCRLGANTLDLETAWIARHRRALADRLDHLGQFLERDTNPEE
ncbi:ArsR/SmtB family transcription factor [Rhodococcus gannanensis]|uniref:ArsR/SmtB family transcription factor n=1 Tax=Rhodococcus gannanensis TaxID=1960308 RepID=A0ABW4NZ63_9NOCA